MLQSIPQKEDWNALVTNLKAHNEDDLTKEKVAQVLTESAKELSKLKIDCPEASSSKRFVVCPPRLSI
jgi:hypothetical protein